MNREGQYYVSPDRKLVFLPNDWRSRKAYLEHGYRPATREEIRERWETLPLNERMNRALRMKPQHVPDLWMADMYTLGRWNEIPSFYLRPDPQMPRIPV